MVTLYGCTSQKTELPPGLLSRSEMVNLLIDVHLLEAKVQKLYLTKDSAVQVYQYFEKKLFKQQGVNDSLYNASLLFYTVELNELKQIYEEVVDSLLARQVALDMKMSVDSTRRLKIVKDSIEVLFDSLERVNEKEIIELGFLKEEDDNISEGDRE
jgi:hypothetical protein